MSKIQLELTLDNLNKIAAAVAPAVEKALEPRFRAIDKRFDETEKRLMDHTTKTVDRAFNELAAMTAKEFGIVHKELNKLAWKIEMAV